MIYESLVFGSYWFTLFIAAEVSLLVFCVQNKLDKLAIILIAFTLFIIQSFSDVDLIGFVWKHSWETSVGLLGYLSIGAINGWIEWFMDAAAGAKVRMNAAKTWQTKSGLASHINWLERQYATRNRDSKFSPLTPDQKIKNEECGLWKGICKECIDSGSFRDIRLKPIWTSYANETYPPPKWDGILTIILWPITLGIRGFNWLVSIFSVVFSHSGFVRSKIQRYAYRNVDNSFDAVVITPELIIPEMKENRDMLQEASTSSLPITIE